MIPGFGELAEKLRRATVQVRTPGQGGGSGVVWNRDGVAVTNAHVARAREAQVELWDGRSYTAQVIARDPRRDLARLQIRAEQLEPASPGDSSLVRPGELVAAIGHPLGFIGALTTGVVHAIGPLAGVGPRTWVQADVQLAPGNSGGPLANAKGEVIGLNTMIAGGIALAIPSNVVKSFLAQGKATPRLGISARPVRLERDGRLGLMVLEVSPGSAAEQASLMLGDILLKLNGQPITHPDQLPEAIADAGAGRALQVQFLRGDRERLRETTAGAAIVLIAPEKGCRGVTTRVLLVASSNSGRANLAGVLRDQPDIDILGSVVTLAGVGQAVDERQPDVLLVEWGEDPTDELPPELTGLPVGMAIVLLTDGALTPSMEMLRSGVRGVTSREMSGAELSSAIQAAARGFVVLPPAYLESLLSVPAGTREAAPVGQNLSPREIEVLRMVADGLGNKQIAYRLTISEHTVKFHIASIMSKLRATSRTEAVTLGIRQGFILV